MKHKDALYQSFLDHELHHSKGIMTVFFMFIVCTFVSFDDMTEEEADRHILGENGALEIVEGRHCFEFLLDIYRQAEADMDWDWKHIRMFVYQHHNGAVPFPYGTFMLTQTANKITALVRRDLRLINLTGSVLSTE